jgi:SAM-dependent methyltransferase
MKPPPEDAREHAIRQWTANPCGLERNYAETERVRYETYPWLKKLLDVYTVGAYQKRVLEIGPGVGTDLVQFARAGAICHGVDITRAHLNHTHGNFHREGLTFFGSLCDAADLSEYGDGYFDLVLCNGVLHHIPEDEQVIAEIHRVLRPGGILLLIVYNRWSWFWLYKLLTWRPWKLDWAGHLATLERGADGVERKPYIKPYTRRMLEKLLLGWIWWSGTECGSPLPDQLTGMTLGGWFHVVHAVKV